MQTYYYPKTIKNITIALMDMFNQMVVKSMILMVMWLRKYKFLQFDLLIKFNMTD